MKRYKQNKYILAEAGIALIGGGIAIMSFYPSLIGSTITFMGAALITLFLSELSKFDKLWVALNLGVDGNYPIERRREKKEGYTLYEFAFPAGLCSEDFKKHKQAISEWLGKDIEISYGYKNIYIKVYDEPMRHYYDYTVTKSNGDVPILIGHDRQGILQFVDLAAGEPHMIIAGETGSGKSTALRAIITNLIMTAPVDLYLIDLKYGAELGMFQRSFKVKGFARTRDEALSLLERLRDEVTARYNTFWRQSCNDIRAYRSKRGRQMRYIVLIIDEFADLMYDKAATQLVEELTSMARACGIHIILSTQRPDAKVINGRIKANCAVVLGLKTTTEINSRIIIDDAGLEALKGKGHGILKHEGELTEVQVPYLSPEKAAEIIAPTLSAPPKPMTRKPKVIDIFEELREVV